MSECDDATMTSVVMPLSESANLIWSALTVSLLGEIIFSLTTTVSVTVPAVKTKV